MVNITFDPGLCVKCGQCVRICPAGHLRMTDEGPEAKSGQCMGCLQCAAICPQDAVRNNGERATVPAPYDTLEDLVMSRRSVRRYKPEPPDKSLLQRALDRGCYAPSGKNQRAYRFTVVYGPERVQAIKDLALAYCRESGYAPELVRSVEKGRDPLTCGAPVLILGWSPDDCLNPCADTILAMATTELLLSDKGLGTCWGGYMRRIADRSAALRQALSIPEGCTVHGCLMVGKPAGAPFANIPVRPGANVTWA